MTVNIISMKEFNEKVKTSIPTHQLNSFPRIGDVEGQSFECGCGKSHKMNFEQHFFVSDMGIFKAVFLSPECGFLNALKLKKIFSKGIENLFSTKFLADKPNFGFDDYPDIATSIRQFKGYFNK